MNRYDSFKDSGVEWIGKIPSHWEFIKTNILTKNLDGKRIPLNSVQRAEMKGEYPYWGSNGIVDYINEYIFDEEIVLVGEDGSPFFDPQKDVSFYVDEPVWVNNHIHILKPNDKILHKYLTHSFNCVDYKEYITGSTRDKLTQSELKRIPHCVPPKVEQQKIVEYLDATTSQIDELIQKKQRKIELLTEYRTSLINEVVTKGLNPNVELKDSGVEWIGEIPIHWDIKKLKYISDVRPSNVDKHIYQEEIQVRLCNYTDVYYNEVINSNTELKTGSCTMIEFQKFKLESGDVIITKDSETPDDIGIPVYIEETLSDVVCGYHLTMLKPLSIDGKFLYRFIQSYRVRKYFELNSNGVTRFGLGKNSIENLIVPSPPAAEQHQIASYLDEQTEKIDSSIQFEKQKIKLLKEYRQSLISEVVTGKIKVF